MARDNEEVAWTMSEFAELQSRIDAAMARIGAGLEALAKLPKSDPAEATALTEALEAERTANAQLEERVKAIRERQENLVGTLEAEVAKLRREMARHDNDLNRLKQVNAELRANNQALRAANAEGLGDAGLINTGLESELDGLRASHDADRAELDAILGELKPLVEARTDA